MNTIKLSGKKVSVTETERGFLFGKEDAAETVVLRNFGEANGFLNAVGYIKDGEFENLQHGFHMHRELAASWNAQDALYVRYVDMGKDIRKFLEDIDIVPQKKQAWFVLNKRNGVWTPGYPIRPLTVANLAQEAAAAAREDLVEKGLQDADDPTMPILTTEELTTWTLNNRKAWNQTHLHNGVELALYVIEGKKSVEIRPNLDDQDWRGTILSEKVTNLVEGKDAERREKLSVATQNGVAYDAVKRTGSAIARNPELKVKAIEAVAGGVTVIISGASHDKSVKELVGATLRRAKDGLATGAVFMKTENDVLAIFRMAGLYKQSVEVVRLSA